MVPSFIGNECASRVRSWQERGANHYATRPLDGPFTLTGTRGLGLVSEPSGIPPEGAGATPAARSHATGTPVPGAPDPSSRCPTLVHVTPRVGRTIYVRGRAGG
jgi:hypothetical protein